MNSKSIATVYAILAAIQEIVKNMGMNISTAINIFIKKVNATRSIPFSIELEPEWNEETLAACKEALDISEGRIPVKR